ncbi:MAG: hypothetical protein ACD_41C00064G0007 [uncultured bacterium]|nr:MAG: hypothetical protein ACD_41C00064G0007 [uncultured bacterium]HBY73727.1 hypothetical protein [Candidatus Kerfeldbacteria bacterium]
MIRQPSRFRNKTKQGKYDRLDYLRVGFTVLGAIIALRLFIVQIVQHGYYEALASDHHDLFEELFPERGEILVHDRYAATGTVPIATNKVLYEVHAEPVHITDPAATAQAIAPLLSIPKEDITVKLDKPGDPDEILKRRVPEEVVNAIKELNLTGITFREEQWRYYPETEYTAHVTGYYGYSDTDKKGQYGLEGYYDKELAGLPGYVAGEKDAFGRFLTIGNNFIQEAVDGDDLVLTIDKNVQYSACSKLKSEVERLSAKEGTLIIMQPDTGAIIAMCNYPSFDPNNYNEVESIEVFVNSAVSDEYEPGSAFKPITMAAGLDTGAVTPTTTYVDTGQVTVAGYPIKNFDGKAYGTKTMTEVLENSLNLGTIFVVQQLGNQTFYEYVQAFGFNALTGIELASEHDGDISTLAELKDVYSYTGSFGHGITVTPLQLINGFAAIANGGELMKPYIVEKRVVSSGAEIPTEPSVVRRVISEDTSRTLSAMLVNVIDYGHAKRAGVEGYYLAGKTGTALVVGANGRYDTSRHNDTFVGYGPISDPQFVMLIKMNEPASQYAEGSVVPLWGEVAKDVLNYYKIPPDRE